jgi:hypothetical protein
LAVIAIALLLLVRATADRRSTPPADATSPAPQPPAPHPPAPRSLAPLSPAPPPFSAALPGSSAPRSLPPDLPPAAAREGGHIPHGSDTPRRSALAPISVAEAAPRLAAPARARALAPPHKEVAERIAASYCVDGPPADVASDTLSALAAAGWPGPQATPHPTFPAQFLLSARDGNYVLTGYLDTGPSTPCPASATHVSFGIHKLDPTAPPPTPGVLSPRVTSPLN